jgi:hypothetical protein
MSNVVAFKYALSCRAWPLRWFYFGTNCQNGKGRDMYGKHIVVVKYMLLQKTGILSR